MELKELIKRIFLVDILKGMSLTLRTLFTRPVTRQYPEERRQPAPGFRGRHALVRDPETGKDKCVGCLRCATVCPSRCIRVAYKDREDGGRTVEGFEIEAVRCVYCAYCVEVCPVCALVMTEVYEYSSTSRAALLFDRERLLKNWDDFTASLTSGGYFNKFWRPEGIDVRRMPEGKRMQGPVRIKRERGAS